MTAKRKRKNLLRPKPASRQPLSPPNQPSLNERAFLLVFTAGVIARILVFTYMGYFSNDNHLEVVKYVAEHWLPPYADHFNQAFHPPLYYFLAAAFLHLGDVAAVHSLSLILSIATLALIAHLLRQLVWIDDKIKPWCLGLAALQPQFIMHGLFISNDALAIFFGVLIFYQCRRLQAQPSRFNISLLATSLGLGLLTKATFLVFVLPLTVIIWMIGRQHKWRSSQLTANLGLFLGCALVLGCYKYAENFFIFGNPMISNLDLWDWVRSQRPTWIGPQSLLDINLWQLVRRPIISTATAHSYPLMVYGSFWYAFVPESTFQGNLIAPINRLGSLIYLAALFPTLLMLIGAAKIAGNACFGLSMTAASRPNISERTTFEVVLLLTLVLNVFLILAVGWRSDVWSVFQGRLLFPSYFVLLLVLSRGMEWAQSSSLAKVAAYIFMSALMVMFVTYFAIEFWLASSYPVDPLRSYHMPYTIDMNIR